MGQAVIWLATKTRVPAPEPVRAEINTADKEFSPHVLVLPVGSTVTFPNHDPFNHNVFSLSEENPFDLGLYGRGETKAVKFSRAGIVRIFCNVHPQMSALVVVRDNPYYSQPSSDGSFTIDAVPAGRYVLHAWHERAPGDEPRSHGAGSSERRAESSARRAWLQVQASPQQIRPALSAAGAAVLM